MIDKKLIILSVLPLLLVIVSIVAAIMIDYTTVPSGQERQLLNFTFTYKRAETVRKEAPVVETNLKSPVEIPETTPPPISEEVTKPGKGLSLIMIRGEEKVAIIDGRLAREGDIIADMEILKIKNDKILVKSKETRWLYMEGTK